MISIQISWASASESESSSGILYEKINSLAGTPNSCLDKPIQERLGTIFVSVGRFAAAIYGNIVTHAVLFNNLTKFARVIESIYRV